MQAQIELCGSVVAQIELCGSVQAQIELCGSVQAQIEFGIQNIYWINPLKQIDKYMHHVI